MNQVKQWAKQLVLLSCAPFVLHSHKVGGLEGTDFSVIIKAAEAEIS